VLERAAEDRRRLRHPHEPEGAALPFEVHRDRTDTFAKHRARHAGFDAACVRQREGGADCRVARHRQLAARREDADAVVGPRGVGREHERCFRERHLARDRLHQRIAEVARRIQIHGELIAGEEPVGEHVEVQVGEHGSVMPSFRAGRRLRS
jgi:hypothetical protein